MGVRIQRARRAAELARVARSRRLLRVLREIGVIGTRPATRESAVEFRRALEDLGPTFVKLGQLLSSRPDVLPDVYIQELSATSSTRCRLSRSFVSDTVAIVGFALSGAIGLYMIWRILRTPGEL